MNRGTLTKKEKKDSYKANVKPRPRFIPRMIRLLPSSGHCLNLSVHLKVRAWRSRNFYFKQIKQESRFETLDSHQS